MTTKKHFVRFYSPGTLMAETSEREINAWDTVTAVKLSKEIKERHGARPYGFCFVTKLFADPIPDGRGGLMEVKPKKLAESGMYYINGKCRGRKEILASTDPSEKILRSNVECNGYKGIVETCNGYRWTQPFNDGDCIVDDSGNIISDGTRVAK